MSIRKNFEIKFFKLEFKNLILWLINFVITSIIAYTAYFLYFFKTIKMFLDKSGASQITEAAFNYLIVLISLIVLIYISLILTSFVVASKKNIFKWSFIFIEVIAFLFATAIWIEPQLLINYRIPETKIKYNENEFTFGAYPTKEKLAQLKEDRYDYVIALMHPNAFPFEFRLLNKEIELSKEIGINIISIPLFPWISNKEEAIKKFDKKIENRNGKFYIHEFNGEGRVEFFRSRLENKTREMAEIKRKSMIKLDEIKLFERGEVVKLDEGIYFTPYPSEKEIVDYLLPSKIKTIISLMDNKNPEDTLWINKEKNILEANSIPFIIRPVSFNPYDPVAVFESCLFVRGLTRPVVVHAFKTNSAASEGFILTFKNQIKSFPPSLFSKPLQNGKVAVILPNMLAGPKPTLAEYKNILYNNGVRGIIYCNPEKKILTQNDKYFFAKVGLSWEQINIDSLASRKDLRIGGLWYIYGADSLAIKEQFK